MKKLISLAVVTILLSLAAQAADTTVKLNKVHLCCNGCVKGAEKAVTSVNGVKAQVDKDAGAVTIVAPDQSSAQKAADALIAAGYFGKSDDASIKLKAKSGAKKEQVKSLKVTGVHLCCDKCVKAVTEALGKVEGVKGNTAAKGADSFEVTGDFKAKKVFTQLNKAGLAGKVGK